MCILGVGIRQLINPPVGSIYIELMRFCYFIIERKPYLNWWLLSVIPNIGFENLQISWFETTISTFHEHSILEIDDLR